MKIFRLAVENVKKIKAVDISPKGKSLVVEGKNGAGKSSFLDSIAYALGGNRLIPENPIGKNGEEADITVEMDDGTKVRRWWTGPAKSYLKVTVPGGLTPSSPQAWLDSKIGNLSFDPMKLVLEDREAQIKIMKTVTGIDTDQIDIESAKLTEERTREKKHLAELEAQIKQYESLPEAVKTRPLAEIQAERIKVSRENDQIEMSIKMRKSVEERMLARADEIKKKEEEIKQLQGLIECDQQELASHDALAGLKPKDFSELDKEMAQAQTQIENEFKLQRRNELSMGIRQQAMKVEKVQIALAALKGKRDEMVKTAKYPVPGLEFQGKKILYNGIEFSECSQSEKIRVSMQIAMYMNPEIKIVFIKDGSLLDKASKKAILDIAEKNDFQVWIEQVADSPSGEANTIMIEEGELLGEK